MKTLYESIMDIDELINDNSDVYYELLKKSWKQNKLDKKIIKLFTKDSNKVFLKHINKKDLNDLKIILLSMNDYYEGESFYVILANIGPNKTFYIDFGSYMKYWDIYDCDIYSCLYNGDFQLFEDKEIIDCYTLTDEKLIKELVKTSQMLSEEL